MKRIIMLSMVLAMMSVSIGGCWVGFDADGRGGRGGEHHDRGGGHDDRSRGHDDRSRGHDRD